MYGKICKSTVIILLGMVFIIGQESVEARPGGPRPNPGLNARPARHVQKPAAKVDSRWEQKADRNNDGYVGPHEADKAKKDYVKNTGLR